MPRLAWATDLHFDHADTDAAVRFVTAVRDAAPDALLVAGDIGVAGGTASFVNALERTAECPVWFVLGNHDYYGSSVAAVRREMRARDRPDARWLPAAGVISVSPTTAVVGHDGWGDGRCGDYWGSDVLLNDFHLIGELADLDRAALLARLNAFGDEAARHFREHVPAALERHERVVVVTHVPPFPESAWYEGHNSTPEWLPYFACGAAGAALREIMAARPDREMLVLCGHTHGDGEYQPLPNLRVITGGAEYGAPRLQGVLDVP